MSQSTFIYTAKELMNFVRKQINCYLPVSDEDSGSEDDVRSGQLARLWQDERLLPVSGHVFRPRLYGGSDVHCEGRQVHV